MKKTRATVSAVIIAQDEQRNLPGLLDRLDWVDQCVVVDGGSRDATASLARQCGCQVLVRPFDCFARQRNFALDQATGDWILSIDADERPAGDFAAAVHAAIATEQAEAYRVPIRSTIFRQRFRRSGTQDDRPVRLFRRGQARWTGEVHERLAVDGRVATLDAWLDHETLPDVAAFVVKMQRYTTLAAEERVECGRAPRWYEPWLAPPREVFRRLVWKQGFVDGPAGWAFCVLSGASEWMLAVKHRRLWKEAVR